MYDNIQTIRYMGNKHKLLDFIIPEIEKITKPKSIVCDLMSGTNCIGYALKSRYTIYANDVQKYSECIAKALIENNLFIINKKSGKEDLEENYKKNLKEMEYNFFYKTYSDTYFSDLQCKDIDSIRFAIEKINDENKRNLYLTALMSVMCKVQSTTGHFAQFMPKDHKRIIPLRNMNVWNEFINKCEDFNTIINNKMNNKSFNLDYKKLIKLEEMKNVETFYLDSPYSGEQYSRFYHILETVVKYDNPDVSYKAKYRNDRFMSDFCYKNKVSNEFENIIKYCKTNNSNLVISYSNKGVISCEKLEELCRKYYDNVEIKTYDYKHSTQGKGNNKLLEYLYILRRS